MGFMGQLDLEALFAIARTGAQPLQFLLRLGMTFLNLGRDIHLLMQTLLGLLDAQRRHFL